MNSKVCASHTSDCQSTERHSLSQSLSESEKTKDKNTDTRNNSFEEVLKDKKIGLCHDAEDIESDMQSPFALISPKVFFEESDFIHCNIFLTDAFCFFIQTRTKSEYRRKSYS